MKIVKKRMGLLTTLMLLLISAFLCSCGTKGKKTENIAFPHTLEKVASDTVATNKRFSLEWNSEKSCVLLRQKNSEKVWSTIPYEFYQTDATDEDMNSPIYIEYVDSSSMIQVVSKGFTDTVVNGRVASRLIENGIEVTYCFDNVGISVPVQYCLREDSLEVSVDFKNAEEKEHALLSVSVAPFLCSAGNQAEEAYIVVPSGCGALMYLDERKEGTRTWSGEIYGADAARLLPESLANDEDVRLPIFGIKDSKEALLAVVEEGREAAVIQASAGNNKIGYSNAYVKFYARGYDILESAQSWSTRDICQAEDNISVDKASVAFYPLSGEDASYIGMATHYQKILEAAGMKKRETDEKGYALYISGGAKINELFLGIPISKTKELTTFNGVENILHDMTEETGIVPAVQMRGYGESGLDIGKVAGGFDFAKVFGSEEQRQSLEEFCKAKGIPLFMDFDLIHFRTWGDGYNTLVGATKSASMRKAALYHKNKSLWNYEEDEGAYYLLKRENVQSSVDKLEKMISKKGISGISLSTLGQIAYSDYSNEKYSARGYSIIDTRNHLSQFMESGVKVATQSANDYAATMSDSIFEVSLGNGDYLDLDQCIPLYQMIFKGYVPMYSTAVNTSSNFDKSLMLAVQSGTAPGFSVVGKYDVKFSTTYHTELHASSYEGNQEDMKKAVLACAEYYKAIQGQTITGYEFVSDKVTKTSFSNGVVVYANHSDKLTQTPLGELEAYGFSYVVPEVEE